MCLWFGDHKGWVGPKPVFRDGLDPISCLVTGLGSSHVFCLVDVLG